MTTILIASIILAAIITLVTTPFFIRYFRFAKLVSTDVHKRNKPLIPHSAGVPVSVGVISAILVYVFANVFVYSDLSSMLPLFAALTSILIITFVGFLDDVNSAQVRTMGYEEGKRGLKRWQKPLLTIPAAFPLMSIMAGTTTMVLPFVGGVDFGILFPLLIVPIGIVGGANMVNMLGGFNGMEVGMGAIYTLSLGLFALMNGETTAAFILLATFASLLAMLKFNFYPAKILPGDTLPYLLGAVVAVSAILGNIEKAAILVMTPFIIQGIIKFYSLSKLGRFASDLGVLQKDGTIKSKYDKVFSLTHILMKFKMTERKIVISMILLQAAFATLPFLGVF